MARHSWLKLEFSILAAAQLVGFAGAVATILNSAAHAQAAPGVAVAAPPTAREPNAVQEFMASLPPSDDITIDTRHPRPPAQQFFTAYPEWVSDHRVYSTQQRGSSETKALVASAIAGFEHECAAKGGRIEPHGTKYYLRTSERLRATQRPSLSDDHLLICMRSAQMALGAMIVARDITWVNHPPRRRSGDLADNLFGLIKDPYNYTLVAYRPQFVVTQRDMDRENAELEAANLQRSADDQHERAEVERWRKTIVAGTETGCGPVLAVNGDLIQLVYFRTREPKWYRRSELWPFRTTRSGLSTCN